MGFSALWLVSLVCSAAVAQDGFESWRCGSDSADVAKCAQKTDAVVEVAGGTTFLTTIACNDCPYAEKWDDDQPDRMTHGDQELFFNVTLANDTRSVLLNGNPIFPVLPTIPHPALMAVPLLRPDFSYTNLSAATACSDPTCSRAKTPADCLDWCQALPLARMLADYSYAAHVQREEADAHIRFWDIVFHPLGGHTPDSSAWTLDDTDRKALHIVVAGQPVKRANKPLAHNVDDGGLFGPVGPGETYALSITKVEQVVPRFAFPPASLSFLGRIRRFFGADVWRSDGELLYLSDEWGSWGKKGTLRNWVGNVFHSNFLGLLFIVLGSLVGGFIALRLIQSLWLWAKTQRSLARWKGIDAVYTQLEQRSPGADDARWDGRADEHHWDGRDSSLAADYRDSYDDGPSQPARASMGWHEERMKPLPTKPLPEKPLPQQPLIDT